MDLLKFVPIDDYVARRQSIFRNREAWRWFVRHHSQELREAGAIIRINGKGHVHPEAADGVVVRVGRQTFSRR